MLAKAVSSLPLGEELVYEPKWDGFRTIVFYDGSELELASRNERPLTRYFPELDAPLRAALGRKCVVDGEIVIAGPRGLDFDALSNRIHPAESRIRRLSVETPASFVAFDLLALGEEDLRPLPFATRRERLAQLIALRRARSTSPHRPMTSASRRSGWRASKAPASTASSPRTSDSAIARASG